MISGMKEIDDLRRNYADAFGTREGMQVLKDLKAAYQMRESYVKGDPYETARREGERSVYMRIIKMCNIKEE
jgi:hypothetical protein